MNLVFDIGYGHFLVLSAILLCIGICGVLFRRNALVVLMSIELMLNAGNLALLTFSRMHADASGQAFALMIIAVAAAEVAVGLAIVVAVFRGRHNVNLDKLSAMRN